MAFSCGDRVAEVLVCRGFGVRALSDSLVSGVYGSPMLDYCASGGSRVWCGSAVVGVCVELFLLGLLWSGDLWGFGCVVFMGVGFGGLATVRSSLGLAFSLGLYDVLVVG